MTTDGCDRRAPGASRCAHALSAALVATVLVGGVPVATAAPKTPEAKAAFDRGVAAYKKGDYTGASEALGASYELEQDIETLFAWAQAERKLDHCDKAVDLYDKLLAYDMPDENKAAIRDKLAECKALLATKPVAEVDATQRLTPAEPSPPDHELTRPPEPERPEPPIAGSRAWWTDPVGGALVGGGALALGVGVTMLFSASSADRDKLTAMTYGEYKTLDERAESRGRIGVITTAVGGALVIGGIVRYATYRGGEQRTQVSGWLTPAGGGGLVAFGRF